MTQGEGEDTKATESVVYLLLEETRAPLKRASRLACRI